MSAGVEGWVVAAFRAFIYADGFVLPLVVPLHCGTENVMDRLQRIFALDILATRAEVWDGQTMIMQIDAGGIAALAGLSATRQERAPAPRYLH